MDVNNLKERVRVHRDRQPSQLIAWLIWAKASWLGYFIGLVIIGISDLAFTFSLLTSGIIEMNAGSVVITPFGMPSPRSK